jgi:hypothetical protein
MLSRYELKNKKSENMKSENSSKQICTESNSKVVLFQLNELNKKYENVKYEIRFALYPPRNYIFPGEKIYFSRKKDYLFFFSYFIFLVFYSYLLNNNYLFFFIKLVLKKTDYEIQKRIS